MKSLIALITSTRRNQAIGLLTIGATVLIVSNVAEAEIPSSSALECVQSFLIVAGIAATAIVFRGRRDGEKYK